MAYNLLPIQLFQSSSGVPLTGGTLTAYVPNTLTPKAIYTDYTGGTQMSNPTPAFNSIGGIAGGIWGTGLYDIVVKDSNGNTVLTLGSIGNAADVSAVAGNAVVQVNEIVFTTSGTYTPTSGLICADIICVGDGGGSGGGAHNASGSSVSGGAASGYTVQGIFTAPTLGSSQVITIGSGGTAGNGTTNGGNGTGSSVGSLLVAPGGNGSPFGGAVTTTVFATKIGGTVGTGASGTIIIPGQAGTNGVVILLAGNIAGALPGVGGSTEYGKGGVATTTPGTNGSTIANGQAGTGYGSGASGTGTNNSGTDSVGAAGQPGLVIIREYIG